MTKNGQVVVNGGQVVVHTRIDQWPANGQRLEIRGVGTFIPLFKTCYKQHSNFTPSLYQWFPLRLFYFLDSLVLI
jgi:hypothetical protein